MVYDDMQYTRRDWRNRNYIKTPQGLQWLTIPVMVKGKYLQKINETLISDKTWNSDHWQKIKHYYVKAPYFKEFSPWVEELYDNATFPTLSEINVHFLKNICEFLNIRTEFIDSRKFDLSEEKTGRLINICKELGSTDYYTGPSAKNYINDSLFNTQGIKIHYFNYSNYEEYPQLFPPFEHKVCIWDLIFNVGVESKKYLKNLL